MSASVGMCLIAPLVGAGLAVALGEFPKQRRLAVVAAVGVMLGGAAWTLFRSTTGSPAAFRGFAADPLRALLLAGAVLALGVAIGRPSARDESASSAGVVLLAGAASVTPLLVWGTHELAVTILVSSAGVAVVTLVRAQPAALSARAGRAVTGLLASDALALLALGLSVNRGVALPPDLSSTSGALLLAAASIRLGLVPFSFVAEEAARGERAVAGLWLGPIRAQGMLFALFALDSERWVAHATAAAAAVTLAMCVINTTAKRSTTSLSTAGFALALIGFATGGSAATTGAVLALASAFAAWPMWRLGRAGAEAARPTLTAVPLGGLIAAVVAIGGPLLAAGAVRPVWLLLAVPAVAGTAALAVAGATAHAPSKRADPFATLLIVGSGLGVLATFATVPARVASSFAVPVATTLGVGRPLAAGELGIAEDLAAVVMIAGVIALIAGPGRLSHGGAPAPGRAVEKPLRWTAWWAATGTSQRPGHSRRWNLAALILGAGTLGLAVRIYIASAGRGFL